MNELTNFLDNQVVPIASIRSKYLLLAQNVSILGRLEK